MPVDGDAPNIRNNFRFVEGGSKVAGVEFCETVTAKEAQLFV